MSHCSCAPLCWWKRVIVLVLSVTERASAVFQPGSAHRSSCQPQRQPTHQKHQTFHQHQPERSEDFRQQHTCCKASSANTQALLILNDATGTLYGLMLSCHFLFFTLCASLSAQQIDYLTAQYTTAKNKVLSELDSESNSLTV